MGIVLEELRKKNAELFKQFCDEAMDKADELLKGSKNDDYNQGGVEITDYFDLNNPVLAAFAPCWRKALREKSLICSGKNPNNESLLDTIVDHLNYLRMLYSTIKLNS